jgi:hypothetical protein
MQFQEAFCARTGGALDFRMFLAGLDLKPVKNRGALAVYPSAAAPDLPAGQRKFTENRLRELRPDRSPLQVTLVCESPA